VGLGTVFGKNCIRKCVCIDDGVPFAGAPVPHSGIGAKGRLELQFSAQPGRSVWNTASSEVEARKARRKSEKRGKKDVHPLQYPLQGLKLQSCNCL